jgi:glycerophosphoryl diester phosphodiesterase
MGGKTLVPMSLPELIAHRGYAARHPENTRAALRAALVAGARFVEVDVQLSAERTPFLFHDRTLERLCGVEGALSELASDAVRALTVAGEPVPGLAQAVELFDEHPEAHAFIELKRAAIECFGAEAVLESVLPALAPIEARCTLISFDVGVLRLARERTSLPLGPVLETWSQRETPEVTALEPDVVFCNVFKLPAEGELDVPGGRLAIYEIDQPQIALDLHARGAALIETFDIGAMLDVLRELA